MFVKTIAASLLALAGLIVGLNLNTSENTITAPSPISINQDTSHLQEKLNRMQVQIDDLTSQLHHGQTQIVKNNEQLNALKNKLAGFSESAAIDEIDKSGKSDLNENVTLSNVNEPKLTEAQRNKNILVSMGVDIESAERIQRLAEKKEMDQLYLRNKASREGWFGTEKYFEKTRELDLKSNIYREELGDDKYDQFLYSSHLTNRITVQSILAESPAELAGLEAGDHILSYNNTRVFNWSDLTSLTAAGEIGENVPIEIQRNSQISELYISRGPLGIRLTSERVDPKK